MPIRSRSVSASVRHIYCGLASWIVGATVVCALMPTGQVAYAQNATACDKALSEATEYALSDRPERQQCLDLYRRVLELSPPRDVELHVRLTMGARMTILYDPELGESSQDEAAIPLYESIIKDFADYSNHHDLMVAKLHLGDLYRIVKGKDGIPQAETLYREVIDGPLGQMVFDDPKNVMYNLDEIAKAVSPPARYFGPNGIVPLVTEEMNVAHRNLLMERRNRRIESLRKSAIMQLAQARMDFGSAEISLQRLNALKAEKPDDQLYQDTIDHAIKLFLSNNPIWGSAEAQADEVVSQSAK